MKINSQILPLLLLVIVSCGSISKERSFLSYRVSITDKFYFISAENEIDRTRPMSLICSNVDTVYRFSRFETVGFDSVDYLAADGSISIHNRIDSAIYFSGQKLESICDRRICIQLRSDFSVLSKTNLGLKEINADKRLTSVHSSCEHMDGGILYELESHEGDKYSIYDCEYLQRDILLFKGSKLINEQHNE